MQRTDTDLQKDIVAELNWEPSLRNDDVAVGVRDGVVTLAGFVDSFIDKWRAERAASKVKGVKAIANEVEVSFRRRPLGRIPISRMRLWTRSTGTSRSRTTASRSRSRRAGSRSREMWTGTTRRKPRSAQLGI